MIGGLIDQWIYSGNYPITLGIIEIVQIKVNFYLDCFFTKSQFVHPFWRKTYKSLMKGTWFSCKLIFLAQFDYLCVFRSGPFRFRVNQSRNSGCLMSWLYSWPMYSIQMAIIISLFHPPKKRVVCCLFVNSFSNANP